MRVTLTALGNGKAFCVAPYYQTNFLITIKKDGDVTRLLIDCGGDVKHALNAIGLTFSDIHAVFVSHLHQDHIGGLEALGISNLFTEGYSGAGSGHHPGSPATHRPALLLPGALIRSLWEHSLHGGMSKVSGLGALELKDYFTPVRLDTRQWISWCGIHLKTVRFPHMKEGSEVVMYSHGLIVEIEERKILITGDHLQGPEAIKAHIGMDLIFSDSEIGNMTYCHPRWEWLRDRSKSTRRRMWLTGHGDGHEFPKGPMTEELLLVKYRAMKARNAELQQMAQRHSFCGFVRQGQVFDLTDPNTYP